ncbi:MAG: galactokinase [Gemmatimonadota bacterium]
MAAAEGWTEAFRMRYGRSPTHAVRAPGRVNLIGEHIDYHGLPVMPFAIDRAVTVLLAPSLAGSGAGRVRIANSASDLVGDDFRLFEPIVPLGGGDWRNYPRAAAKALAEHESSEMICTRGVDALVASDLPTGAGLSSSSALVVGVGLALAHVNGLETDRMAFAARMARAERFVGTEGGGMDQAACMLSRDRHVSLLSFEPLSVEYLRFPEELSVLVADSGDVAEKSGSVRVAYNERRASGASALVAVAAAVGYAGASFAELLTAFDARELLEAAAGVLAGNFGDDVGEGRGLRRFRHVVTEARRVANAREALVNGDAERLGALLTASHASLRDDYEVSTPSLDELVEVALHAGALGARLTGAGFGGAAIALVNAADEEAVRAALEVVAGADAVMSARPSGGATVRAL